VLIVQKYGGTSVGSIDRIRNVASRVIRSRDQGHDVVVVASAMAGETNRLLALARTVMPAPDQRECDVLVATGEQVSSALVALAIHSQGRKARSFLGHQIKISTDSAHGKARIKSVDCDRILESIGRGEIAVVAGFQGVDEEQNITTLGRGGSDTSAVALAAALRADLCEIYTDVDGVYTGDPNICPGARRLERVSYDEMLELASLGAKVLQIRSVEFGKKYRVPLHVRSSFSDEGGTWVVEEDEGMESVIVSGVTCDVDQGKITLVGVPDRPGLAAGIFTPIANANIMVDMIIQNASEDGSTDLTFTVSKPDYPHALALVEKMAPEVGASGVRSDAEMAKVSMVGVGMRSHAGVAAKMFQVLGDRGINIEMISTSEIKISVVVRSEYGRLAVQLLHDAFIEQSGPEGAVPGGG
jgi:aspartate kinase